MYPQPKFENEDSKPNPEKYWLNGMRGMHWDDENVMQFKFKTNIHKAREVLFMILVSFTFTITLTLPTPRWIMNSLNSSLVPQKLQ